MMRKVLVVDDDGDGNLMSELHGSAASHNTHWAHLRNTDVYNVYYTYRRCPKIVITGPLCDLYYL